MASIFILYALARSEGRISSRWMLLSTSWMLYNATMEYASLVLPGEMENYLKGPALHGIED